MCTYMLAKLRQLDLSIHGRLYQKHMHIPHWERWREQCANLEWALLCVRTVMLQGRHFQSDGQVCNHPTCPDVYMFNILRSRQNGCHFADCIFICIFLNGNLSILIQMSLKFVPKGVIDNNSTLVHTRGWHLAGDKPLSESIMAWFVDIYVCHSPSMS